MFERSLVYLLLVLNKATDDYEEYGYFWKAEVAHEVGKTKQGKYKVIDKPVFTSAGGGVWLAGDQITVGTDLKELRRKQALAKLTLEEKEALGVTE